MSVFSLLKKILPKRKKKKGKKGGSYPSYRKQPRRWKSFKRSLLKFSFYSAILGAVFIFLLSLTLPSIDNLTDFKKPPSILVKSEDGQIIGSFGNVYGDYLSYDDLPISLVDSVIATEDRNFRTHWGIDPWGILRATFANIRARHTVQGASTITQQVAKNLFLTPQRSYIRKLKEMILAVEIERRYSKEEIMSIYLNRVYFGAGSFGVDAAAHRYFDKSARDLTLAESAIITGLLKAPSKYAPTSNPERSHERAEQILLNMEDAGYLTEKETARAKSELTQEMKGRVRNLQSTLYFADWIADQLPEYVGNVDEDIVVTTTLKPELQTLAEKSINDVLDKDGERLHTSQAALLSMSPDGAIRVMIGGKSYAGSQFNRATQSQRQPGSSFKLFVYLAGLEEGLTPDTVIEDKPITIPIVGGTWTPKNYTGKYEGAITIKHAIAESINTVAVQVSERVGREKVISVARRLGITANMQPVPSIALGATEVTLLELTGAYAHLAANGAIVYPYGILDITTSKGKAIYHREGGRSGMVLDKNVVGMMNEMLEGVITGGTGRAATIGRPAAGKTGTTSDYKDAWFMGYTPDLVTGVWVGNDDNTPMKKVTGGLLPAQIWHNFMIPALANTPASTLPTGGGWMSHLPWDETPMEERPADEGSPIIYDQIEEDEGQPVAAEPQGAPLGKSFWDKLNDAR